MSADFRVGNGFDVHAFAEDRQLLLGGVSIPHEKGLAGHSDADVLLHAIIDAVLGAQGKGDIGQRFPDNDPSFKDADSAQLFSDVWADALADGWQLVNCDSVLIAQVPRLAPYTSAIQTRLAELFSAEPNRIGVKATTTEQLGFLGRKEGIAASAVVLLTR